MMKVFKTWFYESTNMALNNFNVIPEFVSRS